MLGNRADPFFSSDDVSDAHQVVVHHGRQVIDGKAIGFQQDVIIQVGIFHRDGAAQLIHPGGAALSWGLETHHVAFALRPPLLSFLPGQSATKAVIPRRLLAPLLILAHPLQSIGSAKAVVRMAQFHQLRCMIVVNLLTLRLVIWAEGSATIRPLMPLEPHPFHRLQDLFLGTRDIPFAIGILDANDELAVCLLGEKVVVQRCSRTSDMEPSSGRGGVANAGRSRLGHGYNSIRLCRRMMLSTKPMPNRLVRSEEPPDDRNGSGKPETGSRLRFMPILNETWKSSRMAMP